MHAYLLLADIDEILKNEYLRLLGVIFHKVLILNHDGFLLEADRHLALAECRTLDSKHLFGSIFGSEIQLPLTLQQSAHQGFGRIAQKVVLVVDHSLGVSAHHELVFLLVLQHVNDSFAQQHLVPLELIDPELLLFLGLGKQQ